MGRDHVRVIARVVVVCSDDCCVYHVPGKFYYKKFMPILSPALISIIYIVLIFVSIKVNIIYM